jgi:hypothetical protein
MSLNPRKEELLLMTDSPLKVALSIVTKHDKQKK